MSGWPPLPSQTARCTQESSNVCVEGRSSLLDARSLQTCSPQAKQHPFSSLKDGRAASWPPNSDGPASVAQSASGSRCWSDWGDGSLHSGGPANHLIPPAHSDLPTGSRSCEQCHESDTTPPS